MLKMSLLDDLCRLCAHKLDRSVSRNIFTPEQRDLLSIILRCIPVSVEKDDRYPKFVCIHCAFKLEILFEMSEKSSSSVKVFNDIIAAEDGKSAKTDENHLPPIKQEEQFELELCDEPEQKFVVEDDVPVDCKESNGNDFEWEPCSEDFNANEHLVEHTDVDLNTIASEISAEAAPSDLLASDLKRLNEGRKRKMRQADWIDNKRKILKSSGLPYITRDGKPVPGKMPSQQRRVCKCHHQCGDLTIADKQDLFTKFYSLDANRQNLLLASQMRVVDVKRHVQKKSGSKRHCSWKFQLPCKSVANGRMIAVCLKTFRDSYQVTARRVQILQAKIRHSLNLDDQRGKHQNRPRKIAKTPKH